MVNIKSKALCYTSSHKQGNMYYVNTKKATNQTTKHKQTTCVTSSHKQGNMSYLNAPSPTLLLPFSDNLLKKPPQRRERFCTTGSYDRNTDKSQMNVQLNM